MQENTRRFIGVLFTLGFIICFIWGILSIYSVDVQGIRVLGGISFSKQIAQELCQYKKNNKHYPLSYDLDRKITFIKDFKYKLYDNKFSIEFRVANILRHDTYFTVNNERISYRQGGSGENHGEPVGSCD